MHFIFWHTRGAESLFDQGKEWEKKGEYNRAVEMYIKITPSMTSDHDLVEDAMVKVGQPLSLIRILYFPRST